jgi:hypothetical protein
MTDVGGSAPQTRTCIRLRRRHVLKLKRSRGIPHHIGRALQFDPVELSTTIGSEVPAAFLMKFASSACFARAGKAATVRAPRPNLELRALFEDVALEQEELFPRPIASKSHFISFEAWVH